MRSSVTKRVTRASATHRRMILYGSLLLVAAICALCVTYTNWRVYADIHAREAAQKTLFAQLDVQLNATIKKKVEAAKKAEADAKASAATTEADRQTAAATNPVGTSSTTTNCGVSNPTSITIIINKKHCFASITWAPSDLVTIDGEMMRAEAAQHMQSMIDAASKAGVGFSVSSGYRSYDDQLTTYNYWVEVNGSPAEADKVSARPGYSEHQTGLAADLKVDTCALECFGTTAQYQWLVAHAAEYGFIQRYPEGLSSITGYEAESWHWRYVEVTTAEDMKSKGIQTLELYMGVSGGDY